VTEGGVFQGARASMHPIVVDDGRRAPAKLSSPLTSTLQGSPTLLHSPSPSHHNPSTPCQSRVVATMVTFELTPPTPRTPTSLLRVVGPADITFQCDGQTFKAHQSVVCPQSQRLQDACDAAAKVSAPHLQDRTREADEREQEGVPVVIYEDECDVPTTKRMIDFLYHGEYDVGTAQQCAIGDDDNNVTQHDVLAHLRCYAIGQDYQIEGLSEQALENLSEGLCAVSPDDFAELMRMIAANTEATPLHVALRNAASSRQDELAACKKFMKVLGCGHIAEPASQDQGGVSNLRAAKQLAVHGAKLFRIANHCTTVANVEKAKLVKAYQASLKQIDRLRSQADKDSSTLVLDERVHNDAKDALLASEAAAKQAKDEYLASEERASRMAQAMQKMKLELEVLRKAEHNNKLALEKANKEAAVSRLALEERLEKSNVEMANLRATLEASVEANCRHVTNEQRMAAEIQRLTMSHEKTAAELVKVKVQRDNAVTNSQGASRGTQRVKNEFFKVKQECDEARKRLENARQDQDRTTASLYLITNELARAEGERDQARTERDRARGQAITQQGTAAQMLEKVNQEFADKFNQVVAENTALGKAKEERDHAIEEQKRTASNLEKAVQESTRLRSQRDEARAENTTLRNDARNVHTAMSEGARMLRASNQQNETMAQQAAETASLRTEVNQVRLQNFTLQRSVYDLQFIILNNAENRQQLLEYGGANLPAQ